VDVGEYRRRLEADKVRHYLERLLALQLSLEELESVAATGSPSGYSPSSLFLSLSLSLSPFVLSLPCSLSLSLPPFSAYKSYLLSVALEAMETEEKAKQLRVDIMECLSTLVDEEHKMKMMTASCYEKWLHICEERKSTVRRDKGTRGEKGVERE